jgi:AraC family transcriptional regulator
MEQPKSLKGGSFGEQRSLHLVGGFVVSETTHRQGQNLARHAHERASINFVLDGAYAETFRGRSHAYGPSTLIIKPAGEEHANHFRERPARCLLIELVPARAAYLQSCITSAQSPSSTAAPMLKPLAMRIIRELRRPDRFTGLALEANILELLVASARSHERRVTGTPPQWLNAIVERLHDAPVELNLSELAAEAGVHPAHLARAFRKYFRTSPGEYARDVRLEHAIELLRTSREPIGTIALRAGFFDQSHFTRCVKRKTGMTPGELRRSPGC